MGNDFEIFGDVDAVLVLNPINILYFAGFTGTESSVVLTRSKSYIKVDGRYTIQAREQTMCELIDEDIYVFLSKFTKVGIEFDYVTMEHFNKISEKLSCEFIDVSKCIKKVRQRKTDKEIENVRMAQQITDQAFSHILGYINTNVTEKDIAFELEMFMRKSGASGLSFDTIVASGLRSAMPHGTATHKKICNGDLITMDFGCVYNGYCSDMTRTVAVGNITDECKKIYNLVKEGQKIGLDALFYGKKAKEIDKVVRDFFVKNDVGKYFTHSLGHSLGLEIHESPTMSPKSEDILEKNTLITVEPGIYIEGIGGVRIEDLCVIYEKNVENLTKSKKDLIFL